MENNKIEEPGLSLRDLVFLLRKNIVLVIVLTLVFTVCGLIYGLTIKKITYSATSQAIVLIDRTTTTDDVASTVTFSNISSYTGAYSALIESTPVIKAVKEELITKYPDITESMISSSVSTSVASTTTLIIDINVRNQDKRLAMDIANSVLRQAIMKINTVTSTSDSGEVTYQYEGLARKLQSYYEVESESDVSGSRGAISVVLIAFILGIIVSFAVILIKYLLDDTYTSKDTFEKTYGINVLALLPETTIFNKEVGGKK